MIHDSVDKFYRRIRGNMLYLNDSSEAVRIALIDFDWWNSDDGRKEFVRGRNLSYELIFFKYLFN